MINYLNENYNIKKLKIIDFISKNDNTNKCSICCQKTKSMTSLLKIKETWYCFECICLNEKIFESLRKNGYWFNYFKNKVRFKNKIKKYN